MMKLQFSLKNFMWGSLAGLFFSLIIWLYTVSCGIELSLARILMGVGVSMLAFGITAAFLGIDKLMDNIPPF